MRFRTDGWHYADLKAAGETFETYYPETDPWRDPEVKRCWDETPKAERGDVWRIYWFHRGPYGGQIDDWLAGYAICCIGCGRVHTWTNALNCAPKLRKSFVDTAGKRQEYDTCVHQENHSSCWTWSGSAEAGTLHASPSLQVVAERCPWRCGWHGFIERGDIHT